MSGARHEEARNLPASHPATLLAGVLALLTVGGLATALPHLEWYDAALSTAFAVLRGCHADWLVRQTSAASALLAGTAVLIAVAWERVTGAERSRLLQGLAWLAVSLLLVESIKLCCARARPGAVPWAFGGDSFPSGHVANALLCVGFAFRLSQGRLARATVVVAGGLLVAAIAFARLYLGRHWGTDVIASLLLGFGFWAIVDDVRRSPFGWRGGLMLAVALVGPALAFVSGERLQLSSPVAPAGSSALVIPLQRPQQWLSAVSGGAWFSPARENKVAFLAVDGGELVLHFHSADVPAGLLTIVGRPLAAGGNQCQPMRIVLDGQPLTLGAIWPTWRSYPVALPSIGPGAHELRIRYHDPRTVPDRAVFAVNRIAFTRGAFERLLDSPPAVAHQTVPGVDGSSNGG